MVDPGGHHLERAVASARFEDADPAVHGGPGQPQTGEHGGTPRKLGEVPGQECRHRNPPGKPHLVQHGRYPAAALLDVPGDGVQERPCAADNGRRRRQDSGLLDEDLHGTGGNDPGKRPALERDESFPHAGGQQEPLAAYSADFTVFIRDQEPKTRFDAENLGTARDFNPGSGDALDQLQPPLRNPVEP